MTNLINYNSPIPLYYQLRDIIYEGITNGEWGIGDLIPSENQLCKKYGISRNTVQKALELLIHEGILTRRQGVGTFVTIGRIEQALSEFYSFSDAMTARGYKHTVKVIGLFVEEASVQQAKVLHVMVGESVIVLKRLRKINDVPFLLETSYIPARLVPGLENLDFEKQSLYKTLANTYQIFVVKAKEVFEPVLLNPEESEMLNIEKGTPAVLLERIAFGTNEEPVEFCRSIIPGNKCRFYTELR